MADHDFCRRLVVNARERARENKVVVPRLYTTSSNTGRGRYFFVTDHRGRTLWEGVAHCAYEAKACAVDYLIEEVRHG